MVVDSVPHIRLLGLHIDTEVDEARIFIFASSFTATRRQYGDCNENWLEAIRITYR